MTDQLSEAKARVEKIRGDVEARKVRDPNIMEEWADAEEIDWLLSVVEKVVGLHEHGLYNQAAEIFRWEIHTGQFEEIQKYLLDAPQLGSVRSQGAEDVRRRSP